MYDEAWSSSEVYFISGSEIYEDGAAFSDTVKLRPSEPKSMTGVSATSWTWTIILALLCFAGPNSLYEMITYLSYKLLEESSVNFTHIVHVESIIASVTFTDVDPTTAVKSLGSG